MGASLEERPAFGHVGKRLVANGKPCVLRGAPNKKSSSQKLCKGLSELDISASLAASRSGWMAHSHDTRLEILIWVATAGDYGVNSITCRGGSSEKQRSGMNADIAHKTDTYE